MIVTITKGTSFTCIVAESLTKKTPPSLSPISRSVASCRDIAPKYQLKIWNQSNQEMFSAAERKGMSAV